jgi:hypothetical protein
MKFETCDYCNEEFETDDIIHTKDGNYCEECYDDLKEVEAFR